MAKEHINKFHIPTIREFKKNGWIVDVACMGDAIVPECDHQFDMCWERNPFTLKTIKGIKELKKIIKKNNYNVVYCHTPVGGLAGRLAARSFRKNGLKVVYCAHGLHFFDGAPFKNWLLFYPLEKILARYTDSFITINKEDYDRVNNKFNSKMVVYLIPGIGVDFSRLIVDDPIKTRVQYRKDLSIPLESTVLIYIAELLPNKNQKMLVDVLKELRDSGHDVYLVLPGPDHENGELAKYVLQNELTDRVRLLGWRNDIGELLYSSDIYVASSIREGFGINLVEAMYCGLPVVATNNRGHQMVIKDGENGILVDLNDVEMMKDRIISIKSDSLLKTKLSSCDVSQFDSNHIAERIFSIVG